MKICNTCNTAIDENYAFCPNCGASAPANHPAYLWNIKKEPVSIGGWIGRSLIPMIPLVGGLVYLVMLFIWSGDVRKEDTFRNWAKAQLILTAVGIVLAIIFFVVYGVVLSDILNSL